MSLRRRRLGFVIAALVVGLVTASCGGSSTRTAPSSPSASVDPPSEVDPNQFIVDAYERATGTFADPLAQHNYSSAIAECMSKAGFEYAVPPMGNSVPGDIDRVAYIEAHGYGVFERLDAVPGNDPNEAIVAALSDAERDAYYVALLGADSDRKTVNDRNGVEYQSYAGSGCIYASFEQLGVSMDEAMQNQALLDVAFQEALAAVDSDRAVVAGWDAWSRCMSKAGYTVETRSEARALAHSYTDDPQTLEVKEQQLAAADVACDRRTSLQAVLDDARTRHLGAFYEANAEILRQYSANT